MSLAPSSFLLPCPRPPSAPPQSGPSRLALLFALLSLACDPRPSPAAVATSRTALGLLRSAFEAALLAPGAPPPLPDLFAAVVAASAASPEAAPAGMAGGIAAGMRSTAAPLQLARVAQRGAQGRRTQPLARAMTTTPLPFPPSPHPHPHPPNLPSSNPISLTQRPRSWRGPCAPSSLLTSATLSGCFPSTPPWSATHLGRVRVGEW